MRVVPHRLISAAIPTLVASAVIGCAPQSGPSHEAAPVTIAEAEAADTTSVWIGSDRYYVSVAKAPKTPTAKTKPKSKVPPPLDVEFVLTKSKEISVGLASDVPSGKMQNDDLPFVPASITKVLTAAAVLRNFGPDFKFQTRIGFDLASNGQATNLVIFSDGDPTPGTDVESATRIDDIAAALKAKGVRAVNGKITFVSADPRVDDAVYARGIAESDAKACFGAMSSSFNFNSNCAEVRVGAKGDFRWVGNGAGDLLKNSVETVSGNRTSLSLNAMFSPDRILQGFALRGTYIAKAPATLKFRLPIANGVGWYSGELVKSLRANQIAVTKPVFTFATTGVKRQTAFAEMARFGSDVITILSPPLSVITETMNKHSDNFLADSLFKLLGSKHSAIADTSATPKDLLSDESQKNIRELLDIWLGADGHRDWLNEFSFYDGAGLSADNRATPRAFLAVLRQLTKEATFPALWNSLPIAGVDGTLGARMKKTSAAGKVRGKTGTMNGSYQLVGFIPKLTGGRTEYVPFVILTATTSRNRNTVRKFQDAIVARMQDTINLKN